MTDPDKADLTLALDKYIEYYETLTHRSVRLLEKIADPQMQFKDPFNEVEGVDNVVEIMRKMFDDVENPQFEVEDKAWGGGGRTAYIKWIFMFGSESKRQMISGMSEVMFTPYGLVASHRDFWDAAENIYEQVPVLGSILRMIKKKLAA